MNSRVIAAIAAALLALVGIGAVVVYAAGAQSRAYGGATLVSVYRVTAEVSANASADEVGAAVEQVKLPNSALPKGVIRDLADIQGKKTTVPLIPGEILIEGRFNEGGSASASGSAIPKGLQEVTIALTPDAIGNVSQGSIVGIVTMGEIEDSGLMARMFAQNVLVTNVGEGGLVTFAVNGELATKISLAAASGPLRLTLQNENSSKDGGKNYNVQSILK